MSEVNEAATPSAWDSDVWSFTTKEYTAIEDFESYTDDEGSRIYETWVDGWTNNTGSVVGYLQAPFAERTIIHGGAQSMPLEYNNVKTPYYSETERTFAPVQDWTLNGADTLALYFRGRAVAFLEKSAGNMVLGGGGTDIWNNADQFRFAFKRLSGNGTIVARIDSVGRSDPWAKAGVMIRESLAAGSRYAIVLASPDNGVRFQARAMTDVAAISDTAVATPEQIALKTPVWVKLERTGGNFSGFYSTDGVKWTAMAWNPQAINMIAPTVYIGLAVTSHMHGYVNDRRILERCHHRRRHRCVGSRRPSAWRSPATRRANCTSSCRTAPARARWSITPTRRRPPRRPGRSGASR